MEAIYKKRIACITKDPVLRALEVTEESNFSLLPDEKVERGFVICDVREETETLTRGKLYLSPGAKIKEHTHTVDWEEYIMPDGTRLVCPKGASHFLEGHAESVLVVEFIKHRD